jgi:hypothetical protein
MRQGKAAFARPCRILGCRLIRAPERRHAQRFSRGPRKSITGESRLPSCCEFQLEQEISSKAAFPLSGRGSRRAPRPSSHERRLRIGTGPQCLGRRLNGRLPAICFLGTDCGRQEPIAPSPRVSAFVWTSSFKPFQEGCSKGFAPWQRSSRRIVRRHFRKG